MVRYALMPTDELNPPRRTAPASTNNEQRRHYSVPVPGAVGAGFGRSAVANKELPRGGFELDSRVLRGDSGVHVDHAFFARG
jgi:hypothetical protein